MTGGTPENAREMLLKAELALADGNFIRARSISKQAGTILSSTQKLHRKFMDKMKEFLDKMNDMEDKGYDISEVSQIMNRAKGSAIKSDYISALDLMEKLPPAIERATYLPFPLLNKTVDIISTILYAGGKISYTVRIENPTSDPLGEIIIRPFLVEEEFQDVLEKYYGMVGPMEYKEYTFDLVPKSKDWSLGVDRSVLTGEGVVLRTKLSSKGGTAKYYITVENNSDQIIRDIQVSPMAPTGLDSDPAQATMDFIEPFAQKTVEFDLFPVVLDGFSRPKKETFVVIEEEEEVEIEDEEKWEPEVEEDPEGSEGLDMDAIEEDMDDQYEGPKDFTPVLEKYNLISMSPMRYPEQVEKELKRK